VVTGGVDASNAVAFLEAGAPARGRSCRGTAIALGADSSRAHRVDDAVRLGP
jgi:hypothetical protein